MRLTASCHCGNLSSTADFLICTACGVLVAATLAESGRTWGVLNLRALESDPGFATPAPASPRLLDAGAKRDRWRQLWFPDVRLRDA